MRAFQQFFAIWLLFFMPFAAKAADDILVVQPDVDGTYLGPYMSIVKRTDRQETLQDLLKEDAFASAVRQTKVIPNFGYFDHSPYWARIRLQNPTEETHEFYILNKYAATDALTLFQPRGDGTFHEETLGDQVPFVQRRIPYRFPIFIVKLPPGTSELYFKLDTTSSMQFNISIWSPRRLATMQAEDDAMLGSILGVAIVMLFYNLFIYANFRSQPYLYYVLYIFCFTIFTSLFQGFLQQAFFPQTSGHYLAGNGLYLVIDSCILAAISFARSFLEMKTRLPRLNRFLIGWQILTVLNTLNGFTFNFYSHPFTLFNNIIASSFLLSGGLYLWRTFNPAKVYVAAWSFLLIGTAINVLANGGLIPTNFYSNWSQPIGATCEFILLSFALTQRVALINKEKHQLQRDILEAEKKRVELQDAIIATRESHIRELDHLVSDRTRDIRSILHTINQGIFVIELVDQKPVIQSEYSRHLLTMMNEPELQGRDPLTHIFAKFDISGDRLNQIKGFLDMALGSSSLSFELNSDSLLHEAVLRTAQGESLILEIDWTPMVGVDDIVEKILVTLRDVTQIRRLRELSDLQDLEKTIIAELVSGNCQYFPALQKRGLDLLAAVRQKVFWEEGTELRRHSLAALHTLKGEARVCGLTTLAQAIHQAETDLHEGRGSPDAFQNLQSLLDLHGEVFFHKLGYQDLNDEEVRAPVEPLEHTILHFEKLVSHSLPQPMQPPFRAIYQELNHLFGTELQGVLRHHTQNLSQLAKDLGKSSPNVVFRGERCLIPRAYQHTLQMVFGHLLSNSMSHGLENKDERRRIGKPQAGTISIMQKKDNGELQILYRDDGRGLHLGRIREVGLTRGLISDNETYSEAELAELIFYPGFSTYDRITLTAGRGVGMDAIRTLLHEVESDIKVTLDHPSTHYPGCHDFHFEIRVKFKPLSQSWRETA